MIVYIKLSNGQTARSVWNSATDEADAVELACQALPDALKGLVVRCMVERLMPSEVAGMDSTLDSL